LRNNQKKSLKVSKE